MRFSPYYEVTTLADVTDPNIVHNTERKISVVGIYEKSEVNGLVNDYLAKKGNNALAHWIKPAVDRHDVRQREAFEAGDTVALEELIMFPQGHQHVHQAVRLPFPVIRLRRPLAGKAVHLSEASDSTTD